MAYIGQSPSIGNFQVCDAISVVNGQAAYTMQVSSVNVVPETANHMIVSLNGIIQKPGSSFTVSGSTITFASNLVTGDVIDFIHILGSVLDLGVPSDATVTNAKTNFVSTSSAAGLQIKGDGTTDGTLQLNCSQNSHGIKLKSPAHSTSSSYTLTFPGTDPSADKFLKTDGSGNLSFADAGGGLLQWKITTDNTTRSQTGNFNSTLSNTLTNTITPTKVGTRIIAFTAPFRWYTYGAGTLSLRRDGTIVNSKSHSNSGYPDTNEQKTSLVDDFTTTGTSQLTYEVYLQDTGSSSGSGSFQFGVTQGILHLIEVDV